MSRTGLFPGYAGNSAVMQDIGSSKHIGLSTPVVLGFYQHKEKCMRVFLYT